MALIVDKVVKGGTHYEYTIRDYNFFGGVRGMITVRDYKHGKMLSDKAAIRAFEHLYRGWVSGGKNPKEATFAVMPEVPEELTPPTPESVPPTPEIERIKTYYFQSQELYFDETTRSHITQCIGPNDPK